MTTKADLVQNVAVATVALAAAQTALHDFEARPENNAFDDLETAISVIENKLGNQAYEDCEGAGNCGLDEYTQEFIVSGVKYIGTLKLQYNRHDKTYYYIDEQQFFYVKA